ncbi:MAG: hypothetical protein NTY38_25270, partial [Acidobacteria bacterium]|nr:hypothetical protein [Acidobacteriota bacterium]
HPQGPAAEGIVDHGDESFAAELHHHSNWRSSSSIVVRSDQAGLGRDLGRLRVLGLSTCRRKYVLTASLVSFTTVRLVRWSSLS